MRNFLIDDHYKNLLSEIKQKIAEAQVRAMVTVNQQLLLLYWEIGNRILHRQKAAQWGDKVLTQLSADLKKEYPGMQGFSERNLKYMRTFARENPVFEIGQAPLAQISWYHNITLLSKCPDLAMRLWYANKALQHGWSRDVMVHQIELRLFERQGKISSNFHVALPKPQSDMAQQIMKDPYIFDFLTLAEEAKEKELEDALVRHIVQFLLELGAGFAFVGRQYPLQIGEKEYKIDLLFYHLKLRAYVVIDLKTTDFQPEHAGKMNFYLSAVDDILKSSPDQPSIGLILCKTRDKIVVEYALKDVHKPIGISEYRLTHILPEDYKSNLPSIADLERELREVENEEGEETLERKSPLA